MISSENYGPHGGASELSYSDRHSRRDGTSIAGPGARVLPKFGVFLYFLGVFR